MTDFRCAQCGFEGQPIATLSGGGMTADNRPIPFMGAVATCPQCSREYPTDDQLRKAGLLPAATHASPAAPTAEEQAFVSPQDILDGKVVPEGAVPSTYNPFAQVLPPPAPPQPRGRRTIVDNDLPASLAVTAADIVSVLRDRLREVDAKIAEVEVLRPERRLLLRMLAASAPKAKKEKVARVGGREVRDLSGDVERNSVGTIVEPRVDAGQLTNKRGRRGAPASRKNSTPRHLAAVT